MKFNYNNGELTGSFNGSLSDLEGYVSFTLAKDFNSSLLSYTLSSKDITNEIESHIYRYYPQKKQSQDEKWFTLYSSKLKALSIQDVDTKIIQMTDAIFENKQLQDLLEDIPDEQKPYFEKLVKVSSRIQWAELCISEFQSAFTQNKQALLPDFPEFE